MHCAPSNIKPEVQPFRFDGVSWNHHDLGLGVADIIPPGENAHGADFECLGMSLDVVQDGYGVFPHSGLPSRPWVCGINIEPAGKDNLEEAEFPEALRDSDATWRLEAVRLYHV